MNNDFKKSSYLMTIIFFLIGIAALVGVSAAKYFQFDELVVSVSQIVSLVAFFVMFINCIYTKSKYNTACFRFAEYILTNRRKEAERRTLEAERLEEMQNMRDAAEHDRDKAVAALQQTQSEQASRQPVSAQQPVPAHQPVPTQMRPGMPAAQPYPMAQPAPVQQRMPVQSAPAPMQPVSVEYTPAPMQQRAQEPQRIPAPRREEPDARPNEEVLYNEYGEPVMMRRRVRKTPTSPDGEMLYDSNGNPVIRRNQGLWEPLEQRHEIVFKFETAPGVTMSQQGGREGGQ